MCKNITGTSKSNIKDVKTEAEARHLFVLGCQRFTADLLWLVIVLLWRFRVCLHVSAIKIFICFWTNIFENMRYSQLELISNRGNPRIVLRFEDLFLTSQIQITQFWGQHSKTISLDMQFLKLGELTNFFRQWYQVIVSKTQYLQLCELPNIWRQDFKIVVT